MIAKFILDAVAALRRDPTDDEALEVHCEAIRGINKRRAKRGLGRII